MLTIDILHIRVYLKLTKNLKIGLFGARSNNAGLGTQSLEFFNWVKPCATVLIDISSIDNKIVFNDRFVGENVEVVKGLPSNSFIDKWVSKNKDLDIIFCIETPYNYYLFERAKHYGIKTVLQYNFEFLDYFENEKLPFPTVMCSPSIWGLEKVIEKFGNLTHVHYLPVPANDLLIERRNITNISTFVHIAGYELHEDRNGTNAFLNAIPLVKNKNVNFKIFSQHKLKSDLVKDPRVQLNETNLVNYFDLYLEGDCLYFPRRYGGLSLPANEALCAGMVVAMPNIVPNMHYIDMDCLIPVVSSKLISMRCGKITCASLDSSLIASHIDFLSELSKASIKKIVSAAYDRLPKWSSYKSEYTKFFTLVKNLEYKSVKKVSEEKKKEVKVDNLLEVAVKEEVKLVKVRVLRTFCDGGSVFGSKSIIDMPEDKAKLKEIKKFVEILGDES